MLFAVLAVCAAALLLLRSRVSERNTAVIYRDGELVEKIDLNLVTQSREIDLGGNVVLVEPGRISVIEADCPDKLCVRQGKIGGGGMIGCLPNKILISIESGAGSEADAVVR